MGNLLQCAKTGGKEGYAVAKDAFDFSDLFKQIENEINAVINSAEAKKQLSEHMAYSAYENVYPLYSPTVYNRRMSGGGLGSPLNYEVITGDLQMTVRNETTGNGGQPGESWTSGPINDIIETGMGYGWKHSEIYQMQPYPRPFMQQGIDEFTDEYLLPEIHSKVFNS